MCSYDSHSNSKLFFFEHYALPEQQSLGRVISSFTYVFGSISDSKVCGGRFSFSFFLVLLALGVVVSGKREDSRPADSHRAFRPPQSQSFIFPREYFAIYPARPPAVRDQRPRGQSFGELCQLERESYAPYEGLQLPRVWKT